MHVLDFRLATIGDAALVKAISASAYVPAYEAVIGAVPGPAFEDYTPRILDGLVWIAERAGHACGVLVLEERPDFLMIYSIAVMPEYQGNGFGTELLSHAEKCARSNEINEIRLYTNRRMHRNLSLYRNSGFAEIGERPHPSRPGEVLVDMAKII